MQELTQTELDQVSAGIAPAVIWAGIKFGSGVIGGLIGIYSLGYELGRRMIP